MTIQINPQSDDDSKKHGSIRKKQQADPTIQIIIKTLICILIIDSLIWGYFVFVKKVPLITGIKGWQSAIQKTIWGEQSPRVVTRTIVINQNQQKKPQAKVSMIEKTSRPHRQLNTTDIIHDIESKNKYFNRGSDTMYSWKDEKGTINYSNTGFPEGNIEKLWVRRMPTN